MPEGKLLKDFLPSDKRPSLLSVEAARFQRFAQNLKLVAFS